MSNPTGMHTRTARHLQQVHNRMRDHINDNHLQSAHGHLHQSKPQHAVANAANHGHIHYEYVELNPFADSPTYKFLKSFLYNLLYPQ